MRTLLQSTACHPLPPCMLYAAATHARTHGQGNVTAGQIISVLPFSNALSLKRISGADLIATLQWGVSGVGGSAITGRFPQVRYAVLGWAGSVLQAVACWACVVVGSRRCGALASALAC